MKHDKVVGIDVHYSYCVIKFENGIWVYLSQEDLFNVAERFAESKNKTIYAFIRDEKEKWFGGYGPGGEDMDAFK